jgi:hypothetical protein
VTEYRDDHDRRPDPDPTRLTTAAADRESKRIDEKIANVKELLQAESRSVKELLTAIQVSSKDAVKVAQDASQEAISAQARLLEATFLSVDKRLGLLEKDSSSDHGRREGNTATFAVILGFGGLVVGLVGVFIALYHKV